MCKYSNYGRLKSDQRKPPLFWSTQLITSGERINRLSCVFYESLSGHCSRQSISVPLLLWSVDQRGDICESLNIVDDISIEQTVLSNWFYIAYSHVLYYCTSGLYNQKKFNNLAQYRSISIFVQVHVCYFLFVCI